MATNDEMSGASVTEQLNQCTRVSQLNQYNIPALPIFNTIMKKIRLAVKVYISSSFLQIYIHLRQRKFSLTLRIETNINTIFFLKL